MNADNRFLDEDFKRLAIAAMERRDQEIRDERSKQEQLAQLKLRELEDFVRVGDWHRAEEAAALLAQAAGTLKT